MAVEYTKANKEIHDEAWRLIGQYHPDLGGNLNKGELVIVFREKASKTGGRVVLGSSRKAAPLVNALAGEDFKFILELAEDEWPELTSKQQEALLDHLLCSCRIEHDEETDKTKILVAKPDIMAFRDNVERYGMWFPKEDDEDNGPDPVGDLFGANDDKDDED